MTTCRLRNCENEPVEADSTLGIVAAEMVPIRAGMCEHHVDMGIDELKVEIIKLGGFTQ